MTEVRGAWCEHGVEGRRRVLWARREPVWNLDPLPAGGPSGLGDVT